MSGPNPSIRDRQRLDVKLFLAKPQIEAMVRAGESDAAISEAVGVSVAYAARCRGAIEIALPGGAGPKPWSEADDKAIRYFRDEKGLGWTVIGKRLDRLAKDISLRYDYLVRLEERQARKEEQSVRNCHLCRQPFVSWGRGNRRCDACKEDNDWLGDNGYYGAGAGEGIIAGAGEGLPNEDPSERQVHGAYSPRSFVGGKILPTPSTDEGGETEGLLF